MLEIQFSSHKRLVVAEDGEVQYCEDAGCFKEIPESCPDVYGYNCPYDLGAVTYIWQQHAKEWPL